ncbi:hypothetical protein F5Y15DRAFT_59473 [Xylariaceae sp. FL0016]|nr:hypothetical protein F5Y15DRAFT_59473 [Xylariaceae sp. FL0016]
MDDIYGTPPRARATRNPPSRQAKIKTPARQTRSTAAYFGSEPTTPESAEFHESESDEPPRRVLRKRKAPASAHTTKRQRIQSSVVTIQRSPPGAISDVADDRPQYFPPWTNLSYHVWLSIFDFVAGPIRDTSSKPDEVSEAVANLLSAARTCKKLLEPALANLYRCPPFQKISFTKSPQASFLRFCNTLSLPPEKSTITYRPKVEIMQIDVDLYLSKKYNGMQMGLNQLLRYLPRLSHLELYHPFDDPGQRQLDGNLRWKLSEDDLMQAFEPLPGADINKGDKTDVTKLLGWRWNSRLVPKSLSLEKLPEVHQNPSFSSLRKVAFVNYQLPSMDISLRARETDESRQRDLNAVQLLAHSINSLPMLEHLVLESSTLANGSLLELLPKTLKQLDLINCWEITSEDFAKFLTTHGSSLERLDLKHCQALSLGFLPVLGTSCPKLTHLEMDFNYYRHHHSYADNKPDYDTLLESSQIPTWPHSIQSIVMMHMRNWDGEAATMFFDSLMDNAKDLPHLRRLEFKVNLDIAWRERQELRESIVDKMTRIFKRRSLPPQDFRTLRNSKETNPKNTNDYKSSKPPARRSTRIAVQSSMPHIPDGGSAKVMTVNKNFRSMRISKPMFDADDEDSPDELASDHLDGGRLHRKIPRRKLSPQSDDEIVHGLCDIVDINVDNQRPTEYLLGMEDFWDSAEASDSEWDGGDVDVFD